MAPKWGIMGEIEDTRKQGEMEERRKRQVGVHLMQITTHIQPQDPTGQDEMAPRREIKRRSSRRRIVYIHDTLSNI